jgi:hypothetical protein
LILLYFLNYKSRFNWHLVYIFTIEKTTLQSKKKETSISLKNYGEIISKASDFYNINHHIVWIFLCTKNKWGTVMVIIVWKLDLQLPMQSVPITTNVVSSNPILGKVYSIQHYLIKFVSDRLVVFSSFLHQ